MNGLIPHERHPTEAVRNGRNAPVRRCRNNRRFGPCVAKPEGFAGGWGHSRGKGSQGARRVSAHVAFGWRFEGLCRGADERAFFLEHTHGRGGSGQDSPLGLRNIAARKHRYGKGCKTADRSNLTGRLVFGTDRQEVPVFACAGTYEHSDPVCGKRTARPFVRLCKAIGRVSTGPMVCGSETRHGGTGKNVRQGRSRKNTADLQARHGGARQLSQQNKFEREPAGSGGMATPEWP